MLYRGVLFPNGTEFRGFHHGREYRARVEFDAFIVNGKPFHSPSAAAIAAVSTGRAFNGRTFWECKKPGDCIWTPLSKLLRPRR